MSKARTRPGTTLDIESAVEMSRSFWALTDYAHIEFDPGTVWELVIRALKQDLFIILELDDESVGFVAGVESGLLANREVKHVTELAYWIEPDHRGHGTMLLDAFEAAAIRRGAQFVNMVSLESSMPERVAKIYERLGYKKSETFFVKEF